MYLLREVYQMKVTDDKYNFLFGPVPSRRLGRSLGIDIVPHKICTLNCIYCEVGKTTKCSASRERYHNPDDIVAEFRKFYPRLKDNLDAVTITGAGEPTMNSDFGYILNEVKKISKQPVAVLTNSTLITEKSVRDELMNADIIVPSIDAATQEIFKKVCLPHSSLNIEEINEALVEFSQEFKGRMMIEILLCQGLNDLPEEIEKIADIIKRCKYDIVQLNTVHRPPAFSEAKTVSEDFLLEASLILSRKGVKVEPVGNFIRGIKSGEVSYDEVKRLITMRPCSSDDISKVFGITEEQLKPIISQMDDGNLEKSEHEGDIFYFYR